MIVIPAIDIRAGVCAQAAATRPHLTGIHSDDALEIAAFWERQGFRRLHVMDLHGGEQPGGRPETVRDMLAEASIVAQVGGDIRSGDQVEELIEDGAGFVILGRRALEEPDWLEGTAAAFPGRLIVAMRVQGRQLESRGRTRTRSTLGVIDEFADLPLAGLLLAPEYHGDGLTTDDLFLLDDAAEASGHPLFVAGGVRQLRDLRAIQERGVAGVIVGTALYDGTLDARLVAEEFGE